MSKFTVSPISSIVHSTLAFGRLGTTQIDSFLFANNQVGIQSGITNPLTDSTLESVAISSFAVDTFDVEVYEWDGFVRTLITTINVVAARTVNVNTGSLALTDGQEIQLRLVTGTAKNISATCIIRGTV